MLDRIPSQGLAFPQPNEEGQTIRLGRQEGPALLPAAIVPGIKGQLTFLPPTSSLCDSRFRVPNGLAFSLPCFSQFSNSPAPLEGAGDPSAGALSTVESRATLAAPGRMVGTGCRITGFRCVSGTSVAIWRRTGGAAAEVIRGAEPIFGPVEMTGPRAAPEYADGAVADAVAVGAPAWAVVVGAGAGMVDDRRGFGTL
jgi:hypothetical protein